MKIVPTKTKYSKRSVFIPPVLVTLLKEMHLVSHNGFVFSLSDENVCLHPDSVTRHATLMCKKYDLPHFTPHTLRRTLATTLATRTTVDPKIVQNILGHADIRTLMKYYILPQEDTKMDAIMEYSSFFGKKDEETQ